MKGRRRKRSRKCRKGREGVGGGRGEKEEEEVEQWGGGGKGQGGAEGRGVGGRGGRCGEGAAAAAGVTVLTALLPSSSSTSRHMVSSPTCPPSSQSFYSSSSSHPSQRSPHLHALLPADPQVSTGQEASHGMPGQVVDPAFLPQLAHDGVDPGEPCLGLGPLGQGLHVAVPGDPHTDGVPLHLIEAGVVGGGSVEELPPQQLAIEGEGGRAVLLHLGPEREHEKERAG